MKRTRTLATLLLCLACALVLNAKHPLTANLEVAPNPVQSGEPLAVTSSLTNNTNGVQNIAAAMQLRGPCGVTGSRAYKLLLDAHQTDTSKALYQAPPCPGEYQATLTVSDLDGALLGSASAKFEVSAKANAEGSK